MSAPKTILFPTDFGGHCDRPRERAVRLAREWRARLVILHVLPKLGDSADGELDRESASVARRRLCDEISAQDVRITTRLAYGDVAEEIIREAAELSADLVVTGISRHDEIGDFIVGTTVERLIRRGTAPILVVKQKAGGHYGNLLVGTDFSDHSVAALRAAIALFPEAVLTVMHAYRVGSAPLRGRDEPAGNRQAEIAFELEAFLDKVGVPDDVRDRLEINVDYGDVCSVAREHVRTSRTDLTVIGSNGRSGIVVEVLGSTARNLVECLECDLLLVK